MKSKLTPDQLQCVFDPWTSEKKRNSSFSLSGTGCECDVRGAVIKEQVVNSQPSPSVNLICARLCLEISDYVILNSTKHIDKSHHYTFLHAWLGLGLLTSTGILDYYIPLQEFEEVMFTTTAAEWGIKWHNRRKMLTPAFHFKILEEHVLALNQMTNILTQKLMACTSDDTPKDIHKFITLCSLDIICETAMGISVGAQEGHHNDYAHTIKRMTRLLRHRQTHVWLWRPFTFGLSPSGREHNKCVKVVHNFTEKVPKDKEYQIVVKLVADHLQPPPSIIDVQCLFGQHLQKEGES
uniref:Cytochrome P450 n=1 Tax=Timema poppense TaxID=170557 RepID=A0A7R9D6I5_TIMPO|nr:unnamed protein product [Timema poppensis]